MSDALIVFAKRPEAGEVKTRLTPHLTVDEAAELYAVFVADALEQYERLPVDVRLYLAGSGEVPWKVSKNVRLLDQHGDGLGERMLEAFADVFDAGYERAVIIGTDHPTLPLRHIKDAFAALSKSGSVVIGPAEDGGFYLLGMTELRTDLFRGMDYSHPRVFADTLERIDEASAAVLPVWYDVDRPEELGRLYEDLERDPGRAPRTYALLKDLAARSAWEAG